MNSYCNDGLLLLLYSIFRPLLVPFLDSWSSAVLTTSSIRYRGFGVSKVPNLISVSLCHSGLELDCRGRCFFVSDRLWDKPVRLVRAERDLRSGANVSFCLATSSLASWILSFNLCLFSFLISSTCSHLSLMGRLWRPSFILFEFSFISGAVLWFS